jgi:lysophospholipase L1-like esterase
MTMGQLRLLADSDFRSKRTKTIIGVAVASALVVILVVGLAWDRNRKSEATTEAANAPRATFVDESTYPTLAIPAAPRVLFLGDSLTDGTAATNKTRFGFAPRLAAMEGWKEYQVNGVGKSGFLAPGISEEAHRNYRDRLQEMYFKKTYAPNVIIFQAGAGDIDYPPADVQSKVIETVNVARKYWPDVQIALVGPIGPSTQVSAVNGAYRRAAYEVNIPYVDAVTFPIIKTNERDQLISDDDWHPNTAGHARIAEQLQKRLADFAPRNS